LKIINDIIGHFTIQQVEKIMGIPRTKIRHYLNKELLTVEKDENNGYYTYSYNDLVRLCQIAYYREILDFPLDTIANLLRTTDIKTIDGLFAEQVNKIKGNIKNINDKLNYLEFNQQMINHLYKFKNKISLVPFETFYVFPFSSYFNTKLCVFPILYGATQFSFDGKDIKKTRRCCIVYQKDLKYLNNDLIHEFCNDKNVVKRDVSVYTVSLTQKDIDDPALLLPTINWSSKHRFRVKGPIYLVHFFPFYKADCSYQYIESYLPIDVL